MSPPAPSDLAAALRGVAQAAPAPSGDPPPAAAARGGRKGKRLVSAYVDRPLHRHLRLLAAAEDATLQDLLVEALQDLLAKRGIQPPSEAEGESPA